MTKEEIISGLKFTVDMFLFDPFTGKSFTEPRNDMDKTTIDACKGAIELLEREQITSRIEYGTDEKPYKLSISNGKEFQQELCDDVISRQAVIDLIAANCIWENEYNLTSSRIKKAVEDLPPVIPSGVTITDFADKCRECGKQKKGHWKVVSDGYGDGAYICECSECKDTVWIYKNADRKWNYCPNCGAKMECEE